MRSMVENDIIKLPPHQDIAYLQEYIAPIIEACSATHYLPPFLTPFEATPVGLIAIGKAAADMAQVAQRYLTLPHDGILVVKHGTEVHANKLTTCYANHPIPDKHSVIAAETICSYLQSLPLGMPVVFLLSGGASSLCCLPIKGMSLEEKSKMIHALMSRGANIHELNAVRRAYSQIKGGGLLKFARGPLHTLALSDVTGDDPKVIGSGPTIPITEEEQYMKVLKKFEFTPVCTPSITISPISPHQHSYQLVFKPKELLDWVVQKLQSASMEVLNIGEKEEDSAANLARRHWDLACKHYKGEPFVMVSGGEATTMIKGDGIGGANREYVLEMMLCAQSAQKPFEATILAMDTDGVDGANDVAGGIFNSTEFQKYALHNEAQEALNNSASGDFLARYGRDIVTGPTGTNLNDIRLLLIRPTM